jgi:hypothetical protein
MMMQAARFSGKVELTVNTIHTASSSKELGTPVRKFLILAAYGYLQHGGFINTNVQYYGY